MANTFELKIGKEAAELKKIRRSGSVPEQAVHEEQREPVLIIIAERIFGMLSNVVAAVLVTIGMAALIDPESRAALLSWGRLILETLKEFTG